MQKPNVYKNKTELIRSIICPEDAVLDVGFWGQGLNASDPNWPHNIIRSITKNVYGVDTEIKYSNDFPEDRYVKTSAESFKSPVHVDCIFAGDIIEHLSNPGLFLSAAYENLKDDGKLIITTPNTFNLFNISGKLANDEPAVNSDHVCYFNKKTLKVLLEKNNWQIESIGYIYSLDYHYKESIKKKLLNVIYYVLSKINTKYLETLVVIAKKNKK